MTDDNVIKIKELNLELIAPATSGNHAGGFKLVVVGKPGTGKTSIISSLLYAKKHLIPAGIVMSGSEDSNGFYSKMFQRRSCSTSTTKISSNNL